MIKTNTTTFNAKKPQVTKVRDPTEIPKISPYDWKSLKTLIGKLNLDKSQLKNIDEWVYQNYPKLREIIDQYTNFCTKRNYLIAVEHALRNLKIFSNNIELQKITNDMAIEYKELSAKNDEQTLQQKLSPTKLKNYVPYDKLCEKREIIAKQMLTNPNQILNYMHLLISIVTLQPPLRKVNYSNVEIIFNDDVLKNKIDFNDALPPNKKLNYLFCNIVSRKASYYLFNDKVIFTYGPQIIEYDQTLSNIILKSIDMFPRKYLFSSIDNPDMPFTKNMIQTLIYNTFNSEKINVGIQLIRIAYVTEFYSKNQGNTERMVIAKAMRHSVEVATKIYNKCKQYVLPRRTMLEVQVDALGVPISLNKTKKMLNDANQEEDDIIVKQDNFDEIDKIINESIKNAYDEYTVRLYLENLPKHLCKTLVFLELITNIVYHQTNNFELFTSYCFNFTKNNEVIKRLWNTVTENIKYTIDDLRTQVFKFCSNKNDILDHDYLYWNEKLNIIFIQDKLLSITHVNHNTEMIIKSLTLMFYSMNYSKYKYNEETETWINNDNTIALECNHQEFINKITLDFFDFINHDLGSYNKYTNNEIYDPLQVKECLSRNQQISTEIIDEIIKCLKKTPYKKINISQPLCKSKILPKLEQFDLEDFINTLEFEKEFNKNKDITNDIDEESEEVDEKNEDILENIYEENSNDKQNSKNMSKKKINSSLNNVSISKKKINGTIKKTNLDEKTEIIE